MKARDIMTARPLVVAMGETVAQAALIMRNRGVGAVPVVNNRSKMTLEGILTDRDIAVRCVAREHPPGCLARDHMTAVPITVTPDTEVSEVIATMERAGVRRVPVVDADDQLVGIIAQADVVVKLGPREPLAVEHLLEELSGPPHVAATR